MKKTLCVNIMMCFVCQEMNRQLNFTGSAEYCEHKSKRIEGKDNEIPISEHPALSLEDPAVRRSFGAMYKATSKLYYNGQPPFDEVMNRIKDFLTKL